MAIETRISGEAYERLALAEPDRKWELRDGVLREKPGMTAAHNWLAVTLGYMLMSQLDRAVLPACGLMRDGCTVPERPTSSRMFSSFQPAYVTPLLDQQDVLEVYDQPLPLVVEVWSRSTGDYDVEEKLAVYQQRGDLEIWRIHPYERTLTAWRRQPDGSYEETIHREGVVRPTALPGVEIDLAALFEL